MIVSWAEDAFQKGKYHLTHGNPQEALVLFSYASETSKELGGSILGEARYLSYYGLCLVLTKQRVREGLRCCREAAEMESYRPDLWWNLARVALKLGRRGEAFDALQRGLGLSPTHGGMLNMLSNLGVRRRPVLPFLPRSNPLNVFLGRMRTPAGKNPSRPSAAA